MAGGKVKIKNLTRICNITGVHKNSTRACVNVKIIIKKGKKKKVNSAMNKDKYII